MQCSMLVSCNNTDGISLEQLAAKCTRISKFRIFNSIPCLHLGVPRYLPPTGVPEEWLSRNYSLRRCPRKSPLGFLSAENVASLEGEKQQQPHTMVTWYAAELTGSPEGLTYEIQEVLWTSRKRVLAEAAQLYQLLPMFKCIINYIDKTCSCSDFTDHK